MSSMGLIENKIPKGTFFDSAQYINILGDTPESHLLTPFVLYNELADIKSENNQFLNETSGKVLRIGNDSYLLLAEVAQVVWDGLPIESHRISLPSDKQQEELSKALEHLSSSFPSGYKYFKEFVKVIAWAQLREDFKGKDMEITSSSFPPLPLCVFVSNKALHHIPPNTITTQTSYRFLAENLFHEAIHQAVNMNLLLCDILNEDFDSAESPKITIPWRLNNVKRNQSWEVDRTFHATVVYSHLLGYRMSQLADPTLQQFEREAFLDATLGGIQAARYLSQSLLEHEKQFTPQGIEVIRELFDSVNEITQHAEKALDLQQL